MMKRLGLAAAFLLGCPLVLAAQTTVTPGSSLRWEQPVTDAGDLALMSWDTLVDGGLPAGAVPVLPSACVLVTPTQATCTTLAPAMVVGPHQVEARVTRTQGTAILTATSLPLSVTMYLLSAPQNLRIVTP